MISPQEAYPIMLGDVDMVGNLQAHIIDAPTKNIRYFQYYQLITRCSSRTSRTVVPLVLVEPVDL